MAAANPQRWACPARPRLLSPTPRCGRTHRQAVACRPRKHGSAGLLRWRSRGRARAVTTGSTDSQRKGSPAVRLHTESSWHRDQANARASHSAYPPSGQRIADETAEPPVIAADLLAQAEHDPEALTVLLTTSEEIAIEVQGEIQKQLELLRRKEIAQQSITAKNYLVVVKDLEEAIDFTNKIAPEHLEILIKNPRTILNKIQNSGAIFLGRYSPIAFGDYSAGTNHVLPTNGYSRMYSGLSVYDFLKRITVIESSKTYLKQVDEMARVFAESEKLPNHYKAIKGRIQR